MRPTIGIVISTDKKDESYAEKRGYVDAVFAAGGLPVLIPVMEGDEAAAQFFSRVDGLLLPGGPDVDPVHFSEEPTHSYTAIDPRRDSFELALAGLAVENDIPILGICRGIQLLNVAAGGDIYQDLGEQRERVLVHDQKAPYWYPTHAVEVQPGTVLSGILGETRVRVNSFHHQAVRRVADGFLVSATASDGVIEAIENPSLRFALGVQWHPERMFAAYPIFLRLFSALVAEAGRRSG